MIEIEGLAKRFGIHTAVAAGLWAAVSAGSFAATWTLGRRALENHEE